MPVHRKYFQCHPFSTQVEQHLHCFGGYGNSAFCLFGYCCLFGLFEKPASAEPLPEDFFLGVTADGNVTETKLLIDKVKDCTNWIAFTNLAVTENLTRLEEVTDYAYDNGLSFLVFTVYPSPFAKNFTYNPITWGPEAKNKYGDKFLGFYIWDEPGGNQLDRGMFRQLTTQQCPMTIGCSEHLRVLPLLADAGLHKKPTIHLRLRALLVRLRGRLRCGSVRVRMEPFSTSEHCTLPRRSGDA
jgi:hypothetical protein